MQESDIMHDDNQFAWVFRDRKNKAYVVMRYAFTHSKDDSAYPMTDDGLALAVARAQYISKREREKAGLPC